MLNNMTSSSTQRDNKDYRAHGAMLLAMVLFGLMATFSLQDMRCGTAVLDRFDIRASAAL